ACRLRNSVADGRAARLGGDRAGWLGSIGNEGGRLQRQRAPGRGSLVTAATAGRRPAQHDSGSRARCCQPEIYARRRQRRAAATPPRPRGVGAKHRQAPSRPPRPPPPRPPTPPPPPPPPP